MNVKNDPLDFCSVLLFGNCRDPIHREDGIVFGMMVGERTMELNEEQEKSLQNYLSAIHVSSDIGMVAVALDGDEVVELVSSPDFLDADMEVEMSISVHPDYRRRSIGLFLSLMASEVCRSNDAIMLFEPATNDGFALSDALMKISNNAFYRVMFSYLETFPGALLGGTFTELENEKHCQLRDVARRTPPVTYSEFM